jgi:hypothetical protein
MHQVVAEQVQRRFEPLSHGESVSDLQEGLSFYHPFFKYVYHIKKKKKDTNWAQFIALEK